MNNDLIKVGILGKVVGLKGFIKFHDYSDFPEQFKKNAIFYLKDHQILKIKDINRSNSTILFENYENIDLAKELVNKEIFQTIDNTRKNCNLKDGEYFYFDIIGLEICEDDEIIGVVDDILEVGFSSLLKIKSEKFKDFFIPYPHNCILKISLEDKKIYTKDAKLFCV